MICYRYDSGTPPRIVTCEDMGRDYCRPVPLPPLRTWDKSRLGRRERRRIARGDSGPHRQGARRVSAWRATSVFAMRPLATRMVGHLLAYSTGYRVLLYLPSDVALTQAHIDDVNRADRETR